ncbi:MAG: amidohydrolase family protein, partial [Gemmatimonadales bacterium]
LDLSRAGRVWRSHLVPRRSSYIGGWIRVIGAGTGLMLCACSDGLVESVEFFPPDAGAPVPQQISDADVAFTNVSLVPMTFEGVVASQTVIVRNGVIDEIGPSDSVVVPAGVVEISGEGRFLMPGLTDMHTHVATSVLESGGSGQAQMREAAEGELLAYVAFGVTTILNNGDFGAPLNDYKQDALTGEIVGPTVYTANYARGSTATPDGGPPNRQVLGEADARDFVISSKQEGYDFIKVYDHTPVEAFDALVDEAATQGMAVIGHFPMTMSQEHALRTGMVMVAHGAAYLWTGLDTPGEIPAAVALTSDTDAFVTSTLAIREKIGRVWGGNDREIDALLAHPANRFAHPTSVRVWRNGLYGPRWDPPGSRRGDLDRGTDLLRSYMQSFHDSGVTLLLGSDSPTVLGVAGYSIHEELEALTRLDLTPFQILQIATVNADVFISRYVQGAAKFGTVEKGNQADLILLSADPLAAVANLGFRVGVMTRGHWYSSQLLRDRMEELALSYGN